jgi:hypothetical protein
VVVALLQAAVLTEIPVLVHMLAGLEIAQALAPYRDIEEAILRFHLVAREEAVVLAGRVEMLL